MAINSKNPPHHFSLAADFPTIAALQSYLGAYGQWLREGGPGIAPQPDSYTRAAHVTSYHFTAEIVLSHSDVADQLVTLHNRLSYLVDNRAAAGITQPLEIAHDDGHWGKWTLREIRPLPARKPSTDNRAYRY